MTITICEVQSFPSIPIISVLLRFLITFKLYDGGHASLLIIIIMKLYQIFIVWHYTLDYTSNAYDRGHALPLIIISLF